MPKSAGEGPDDVARTTPPALIALSPGTLDETGAPAFLRTITGCMRAGLRGLLLREPLMSDRATLALAQALRRVLDEGWLGLHDRVHLAQACAADAVHLGFRSLTPPVARDVLPARVAIGFSAHASDAAARRDRCDHIFFGPVLATPTKQGLQDPVGFEGLATAVSESSVPVWAIGGLGPDHVRDVIGLGARGVAVLRGIVLAPDPPGACERYLDELRACGRAV